MCFLINIGRECHGSFVKGQEIQLVPRPTLPLLPRPPAATLSFPRCGEAGGNTAAPGCPRLTSRFRAPPTFVISSLLSRLDMGLRLLALPGKRPREAVSLRGKRQGRWVSRGGSVVSRVASWPLSQGE